MEINDVIYTILLKSYVIDVCDVYDVIHAFSKKGYAIVHRGSYTKILHRYRKEP